MVSLITSAGTGASTIWIHDKNGDRPLSEESYSFNPQFSRDGKRVFYLASQRPRAVMIMTGELWSVSLDSAERRRLPGAGDIVRFAVEPDRNQVLFLAVGPDQRNALWLAPLDGREAPRRLADDVSTFRVSQQEIIFAAREGTLTYVYLMGFDGTNRRKALPEPVVGPGLHAVSPDRKWLIVEDRIAIEGAQNPLVLYPLGGDTSSRIPVCAGCLVSWVFGGRYLQVRFGNSPERPTYLAPVPPGEILPALFRTGRLVSEAEVAKLPGVRVFPQDAPAFGADLDTYVYTKSTVHRNLFRIPLE